MLARAWAVPPAADGLAACSRLTSVDLSDCCYAVVARAISHALRENRALAFLRISPPEALAEGARADPARAREADVALVAIATALAENTALRVFELGGYVTPSADASAAAAVRSALELNGRLAQIAAMATPSGARGDVSPSGSLRSLSSTVSAVSAAAGLAGAPPPPRPAAFSVAAAAMPPGAPMNATCRRARSRSPQRT